ncbi:type II toxin-antitoxin system RelE/ParE family toxin [Corticibacterium sp. UT-5YL-CI-8]|nr:type II toxin-antitoxin system RelE/ParE family toxin [Tianweitania sp. UT-5YL-CI-8]
MAAANSSVGLRFADELLGRFEDLSRLPATMGRPRPELRKDMRSFAHEGYVIFFRYRDDLFEVLNVLEGHRDIDTYFHSGDD